MREGQKETNKSEAQFAMADESTEKGVVHASQIKRRLVEWKCYTINRHLPMKYTRNKNMFRDEMTIHILIVMHWLNIYFKLNYTYSFKLKKIINKTNEKLWINIWLWKNHWNPNIDLLSDPFLPSRCEFIIYINFSNAHRRLSSDSVDILTIRRSSSSPSDHRPEGGATAETMFISCGEDASGAESEMGYVPNNPLFGLPLESPHHHHHHQVCERIASHAVPVGFPSRPHHQPDKIFI